MIMMRREYLEFETVPTNEDCAQVGSDNYYEEATAEIVKTIKLLESKFFHDGNKEVGLLWGDFSRKSQAHDFGTYYEIRYSFYEDEEVEVDGKNYCAWDFANFVESNWPETWNDDTPVSFKEWMEAKSKNDF